MKVSVLLFEDFETLDVFGPVEILGRLTDFYQISFYSLAGDLVRNSHGIEMLTRHLDNLVDGTDILLIPGGHGTRTEVNNKALIDRVRQISLLSRYVFTVCTGTAILARTGLLDGKKATTNKKAFDWVTTQGEKVNWQKKARWCVDGNFYTSAGVSAGMDMTLGFLSDIHGLEFARKTARDIEYDWKENCDDDSFYYSTVGKTDATQ